MLATSRGARLARAASGLAALFLSVSAIAGKLADAGRSTRTSSSSSSSSSHDSHSSDCYGDDGHHHHHHDDDGTALLILTLPWTGPYYALESTHRGAPVYEDYPYARGSNGLLHYRTLSSDDGGVDKPTGAESAEDEEESVRGQSVAAQVRAEGGYILGGVYRGGFGARLMLPGRVEFDGNFNALAEPVPNGSVDHATFGNAHLGLRFAQSERVQFHTGLGYQQYADAVGVEPGIDFYYGFEVQPGAHLVLSFSGNAGSAGHAFVGQARASLGVMAGPVEIFAGYDYLNIGGVELGGPAAGLRAWL